MQTYSDGEVKLSNDHEGIQIYARDESGLLAIRMFNPNGDPDGFTIYMTKNEVKNLKTFMEGFLK